jgi:hypothetical protein
MESHSLRAGCIACGRVGPRKWCWSFKGLLVTLYVTLASALCELVLIVMINEIALFYRGLPAEVEKSTKRLVFWLLLNWDTLFANLLVIISFWITHFYFSLIQVLHNGKVSLVTKKSDASGLSSNVPIFIRLFFVMNVAVTLQAYVHFRHLAWHLLLTDSLSNPGPYTEHPSWFMYVICDCHSSEVYGV